MFETAEKADDVERNNAARAAFLLSARSIQAPPAQERVLPRGRALPSRGFFCTRAESTYG